MKTWVKPLELSSYIVYRLWYKYFRCVIRHFELLISACIQYSIHGKTRGIYFWLILTIFSGGSIQTWGFRGTSGGLNPPTPRQIEHCLRYTIWETAQWNFSTSKNMNIYRLINFATMLYICWAICISSFKAAILDFRLPLTSHSMGNSCFEFIDFGNMGVAFGILQ